MTGKVCYKIAFVGECMIELKGTPLKSITQKFSGDTLNTAVYLSRLTRNRKAPEVRVEVNYITAIGCDAFSQAMEVFWHTEGIRSSHVLKLSNKAPGLYFISLDDKGERSFTYWRDDSAARQVFEREESAAVLNALQDYNAVYVSGISLAILPPSSRNKLLQSLHKLKSKGGKVFFDNNYRPVLWESLDVAQSVYNQILSICDIALLTLDDERDLFGTIDAEAVFERCSAFNINEIVIKCGADACEILASGERVSVPAQCVENVVDTTAAGDSFSAAYLAARINDVPPLNAAKAGHALAADVIQIEGAF